ncbi:MAG: hypothetical protein O3B31_11045, partial [Chloroflexi bacterium]|nr:hypothetical protein [Chloroflexota bacterium]
MAEFASSALRARRAPVPAALFSPRRPPSFVLFTASGVRAQLTPAAGRPADDLVYVSRFDFVALIGYLRDHLAPIVNDGALAPDVRAWALHRVLVAESVLVARTGSAMPGRELVAAARELAAFTTRE